MGGQPLPPKEANLFKQVIKFYENKQYKKGIRTADTILKKFPDHGDVAGLPGRPTETLAMKGLILNFQDKKEEGYELVRRGLKCDLKSHISWHVYGLLYRSDRNYEEAVKCYRNALRIDKDNYQIIRDLALLEIQLRSYDTLLDTRLLQLQLRPSAQASWIGMAVTLQMMGHLGLALDVLDAHEAGAEAERSGYNIERSELHMYKSMLYEEAGRYEQGLEHLAKFERDIYDDAAIAERRISFLLKLGRFPQAEALARQLLDENPDNADYYRQLAASLQIGPEDAGRLVELYADLAVQYPRAHLPRRLTLNLVDGEDFRQRADAYLRSWLGKGAPSLFTNLRNLYQTPAKVQAIQGLFEGYLVSLRGKPSRFDSADTADQNPTALLWTLVFAAQHYAQLRQFTRALELIEEAIAHTPTVVEVLAAKAKILKQAGDIAQAAEVMNQARLLDGQDRFINSKSTKYLQRADQLARADDVVALFAKGEPGEPGVNNLHAMQCIWYPLECATSHVRQRQYGRALKRLHEVDKHFTDITDDQLDFHSYSLRKMTMRAYVGMLRMEDQLHAHRFYQVAAREAVQLYLQLHDQPKQMLANPAEDEFAHLSESERKKALNKLKKAEAKAKAAKEAEPKKDADKKKTGKAADDDPDGLKLLQTTNPLGDALKFVIPLQTQRPTSVEAHTLAAEVHLRRGKPLLVLKALKRAQALQADFPPLHRRVCKLAHHGLPPAAGATRPPAVQAVIDQSLAALTQGQTALALNDAFLARNAASLAHAVAAAEVLLDLGADKAKAAAVLAAAPLNAEGSSALLKTCTRAHQLLATAVGDPAAAAAFAARAHAVLPLAPLFQKTA